MADRFVRFKDRRPDKVELEVILRNFLGSCGTVEWERGVWTLQIPGMSTSMFKDTPGALGTTQQYDERWIEVHWGRNYIDVLTRAQDDFTMALADYLAARLARFYGADLDDD